jgi:hypothetical protein
MGRGIGPPGGNLLVGHRGSVSGPSPSESKNASASLTRLVLYVSGREAWVFVSFGTQKVISYARNVTPPYGGDLLEVIPRRRRGGFFVITNEPEQPIAKAPPERSEGAERGGGWGCSEVYWRGPGGAANDGERGGRGGGRGAGTEYPVAVAGPVSVSRPASEVRGGDVPTDGWDSPPGRFGIYHDLDAGEGQNHV